MDKARRGEPERGTRTGVAAGRRGGKGQVPDKRAEAAKAASIVVFPAEH